MRLTILGIVLFILSCAPKRDRIVVPVVNSDFYSKALIRIDDDLEDDEDNLKLVEQKLYYCDLLGWPGTCISALDELKRQKGMTPLLLDQYITYYSQHEQYQSLLDIIDRWSPQFDLEEEYRREKILGLVKSSRRDETYEYLRVYMADRNEADDYRFAANSYLALNDSIMSSFYMNKLSELVPDDQLVLNVFPYLLFDLSFEEKAFEMLERKSMADPTNYTFHSDLADKYENTGRFSSARRKLQNFLEIDSVIYRVTDLYLKEDYWDSAHRVMNILIDRDSLNRDAWFKKATMYEERGWLSYSLNYYDHVVYLNPNDSIALERAELVRQKIAYLQRLKFEENLLPPPVLKSKRLINNE